MNKITAFIKSYIGLLAIGAAFIISAFVVYLNNSEPSEDVYTVTKGDTVASIAAAYKTTAERIVDLNYPDVDEKAALTPGMRLKVPRGAGSKQMTIRIAHWSLEPGARDGLNFMAAEYHKLYPNVRVVQEAIPEATYGQWFTTQMVGGTPADLMRDGMVAYPLLVSYYMRYFTPMTEYVMAPNPYNRNNEFRDVSLRDTMKDGLRNCYIPEMQEYMAIGLTLHIVRMFYNKTMLKRNTGSDVPPATFREFIDVCGKVEQYKFFDTKAKRAITGHSNAMRTLGKEMDALADGSADRMKLSVKMREHADAVSAIERGLTSLTPIANSRYHMNQIEANLFNVITTKARNLIDFDHDCTVSVVEQYAGMKGKKIDMDYGPYRAKFDIVSNYCRFSIPGFSGLNRDDAVMFFVQQRSLFIPTGTWDAGMLERQASDNGFEVGVMDFPYPGPDSPELYRYFEGPAYEDPVSSFRFACATPEGNPERQRVAIDFLLFMAAKENNIKLNGIIGWNPNIVGGIPDVGLLKGFHPHADGVVPAMNFQIGGESTIKWQQIYALFWVGQISYEKFCADFVPFYLSRGYQDYITMNKNWRRSLHTDEKLASMLRVKGFLSADTAKNTEQWVKYRYAAARPLVREMNVSYERALLVNADRGKDAIPTAYEYAPAVKARYGMH